MTQTYHNDDDEGKHEIGHLKIPQQDIENDLPEDVDVFNIDEETTMLYKTISDSRR